MIICALSDIFIFNSKVLKIIAVHNTLDLVDSDKWMDKISDDISICTICSLRLVIESQLFICHSYTHIFDVNMN